MDVLRSPGSADCTKSVRSPPPPETRFPTMLTPEEAFQFDL